MEQLIYDFDTLDESGVASPEDPGSFERPSLIERPQEGTILTTKWIFKLKGTNQAKLKDSKHV